MLKYVTGDLLLSGATAIAHGIAANEHFDHGLARALREKWPSLAKDYRHYANTTHPKAGGIWLWGGHGIRIWNLLTQDGGHEHGARPGKASASNVLHALKALRHALEKEPVQSLALPRLATGVGGLDWDVVQPILAEQLGGLGFPIYVYETYHAGVKADEA
ncbi:MAG: macro domain-containing protein [Xanthomonadales bacterium]|nr:macro domain-containing protein [Xanthomonadales bacterium]